MFVESSRLLFPKVGAVYVIVLAEFLLVKRAK